MDFTVTFRFAHPIVTKEHEGIGWELLDECRMVLGDHIQDVVLDVHPKGREIIVVVPDAHVRAAPHYHRSRKAVVSMLPSQDVITRLLVRRIVQSPYGDCRAVVEYRLDTARLCDEWAYGGYPLEWDCNYRPDK